MPQKYVRNTVIISGSFDTNKCRWVIVKVGTVVKTVLEPVKMRFVPKSSDLVDEDFLTEIIFGRKKLVEIEINGIQIVLED